VAAGSVSDAAHHAWLLAARQVEVGDVAGVEESMALMRRYAELGDNPWARVLESGPRFIGAYIAGDLEQAELLSHHADELADAVAGLDGAGGHGQQMFAIRREQQRLNEVRPVIEMALARGASTAASWRPGAAALFADLGLLEETARELESLVGDTGPDVPVDARYTTSLSFVAEACVAVEDVQRAAVVRAAFLPYSGLTVVMPGVTCLGPVDRYLGRLAAVLGEFEEATACFDRATELARAMASPLFEAHALADRAELALHIGSDSDARHYAEAALGAIGQRDLPRVRSLAISVLQHISSNNNNRVES